MAPQHQPTPAEREQFWSSMTRMTCAKLLRACSRHSAIRLCRPRAAMQRWTCWAPDSTVAVLVADYTMPGMNGLELARAARAKRTDLPVVIVTGYAEITGLDAQAADAVFLKKPFEREELVAAIKLAVQRIARERKLGQVVALPVS